MLGRKVFLTMTLVFFAYRRGDPPRPDWEKSRGAFIPLFERTEYLFLLVALPGTTITPFMPLSTKLNLGMT
jgi:Mn2+/Fe2+ NRAMP family transporter